VADFRGSQAVPIGNQDHGRVAMPVAAMLAGAVHEPFDLALGEVGSFNCQVYDGWRAFLGCRFHADKPCLRATYCLADTFLAQSASYGGVVLEPINTAGKAARAACYSGRGWMSVPDAPPGRGDFSISNFHPGVIPGNLAQNDFWW